MGTGIIALPVNFHSTILPYQTVLTLGHFLFPWHLEAGQIFVPSLEFRTAHQEECSRTVVFFSFGNLLYKNLILLLNSNDLQQCTDMKSRDFLEEHSPLQMQATDRKNPGHNAVLWGSVRLWHGSPKMKFHRQNRIFLQSPPTSDSLQSRLYKAKNNPSVRENSIYPWKLKRNAMVGGPA